MIDWFLYWRIRWFLRYRLGLWTQYETLFFLMLCLCLASAYLKRIKVWASYFAHRS